MIVETIDKGTLKLSHVYRNNCAWCIAYEAYPDELEFMDEGPFTTAEAANLRMFEMIADDPIVNKGIFVVPIKAFYPWTK